MQDCVPIETPMEEGFKLQLDMGTKETYCSYYQSLVDGWLQSKVVQFW
jgi:hypothetical protein